MKTNLPKIVVKALSEEKNIEFITRFISPKWNKTNQTLPFDELCYQILPELKGKITDEMDDYQVKEIVSPIMKKKLRDKNKFIESKVKELQEMFNEINDELLTALSEVHKVDWPEECKEIICWIGYLPVAPRDVITKEFWTSVHKDNKIILKNAVHEMGHFIFYEKFKAMYGPVSPDNIKSPSPRWYLEEMIVDPLLNDKRIQKIVPIPQYAYQQFYTETIQGNTIMDTIKELYNTSSNIEEFIEKSYIFVKENIEEINRKCNKKK